MPEDRDERDEAVNLSGWERRTTIDEPRLSELVEFYEELGFDVLLRPVSTTELGPKCAECILAAPERYRTIYTRPREEGQREPGKK